MRFNSRYSNRIRFGCAMAALLLSAFAVLAQTPPIETQKLTLNQPIERQIKGGETHSFQFKLKAGEYALTEVEQKNIDVVVSLFDSNGKLVIEMDGGFGMLWREAVSAIAATDGAYRIQIEAYGTAEQSGSYRVNLVESHLSAPIDRQRLKAETHLSAGRKIFQQGMEKGLEAVKEYETAVALWRELGETEWEAITLVNLGWANRELSKNEQAIETHLKALALFRKINNRVGEYKTLYGLGSAYEGLNQYGKARDFYERALIISREIIDLDSEAEVLNMLGNIYFNLGDYEKSLRYCGEILAIRSKIGDRRGEANALACFGDVYRVLNQYEKTQEYYEQALTIIRKTKNRTTEATFLNNLAVAYFESKQYEKARDNYEQALIISRDLKNRSGEAIYLVNAGVTYENLNQNEKAEKYYKQALIISKEIGSQEIEINSLISLGEIKLRLNKIKESRSFYEQALVITREIKNREIEGDILHRLMLLYEKEKKTQLAIIYGKQAVNVIQEIRINIKNLDTKTQTSFLKQKETIYRKLADLLIAGGRLIEAQTVLDLLKEQEFKDVVPRRNGETPAVVPYSQAEASVSAIIENLAKLERERAELLKQKETGVLSVEQQSRLDRIPVEIEAANKAFRLALDALGKAETGSANRVAEIQGEKSLQRALQTLRTETDSTAVALYTVLGNEQTGDGEETKTKFGWVILVTPTSRKAYPIDVSDLEQTVFQFRDALSSDRFDPQPVAQKLYDKIFRQSSAKQKTTLEADLQTLFAGDNSKNKTLMWSLDGILRYVPMAALYDGKSYLVEKYGSVIFTKESFLTLTEKNAVKWNALGLGVSERRENFNALPGAERELKDIVRVPLTKTGIMDGEIKLNKDFAEEATLKLLREGKYPVIHIASHYSFNATDPTSSYLLVGDGHLSFSEMQDKDNLFGAIDLLTLSACDTATSGNGKEAEGFAYLAQSLGAKAVIASLWQVSDAGTPELMTRFYKMRVENPEMPKGEAFRRAQLSLLGAEVKADDKTANGRRSEIVDLSGKKIELPLFVKDAQKPFAHPHYWSSFVLIGNWR